MVDKPSPGYRVARSPTVAYRWAVVAVLLGAGYGLFQLGGEHRAGDYKILQNRLMLADEELRELNAHLLELRSEVASLNQRQKLDQQARRNDAVELGRLRHQLTESRKELELYSRLADRNLVGNGTGVRQLKLSATEIPGEYRYDLLLAQALTATSKASGRVKIEFVGSAEPLLVDDHGFSFQLFERFSGVIVVPEGVAISRAKILVTIIIKDRADSGDEFWLRELLGAGQADEQS